MPQTMPLNWLMFLSTVNFLLLILLSIFFWKKFSFKWKSNLIFKKSFKW